MCIVIVGGNERMECMYESTCKEYNCKVKIFTKKNGNWKNQIGSPDLLILFTNTVSHKMLSVALKATDKKKTIISRSHTSSLTALKEILNQHAR